MVLDDQESLSQNGVTVTESIEMLSLRPGCETTLLFENQCGGRIGGVAATPPDPISGHFGGKITKDFDAVGIAV